MHTSVSHRRAFTLVELLVVMGVLVLIIAIAVPTAMQALSSARNAAIKIEIDLLASSIVAYKAEYGSYPPCYDPGPENTQEYASNGPALIHIRRLFPRINQTVLRNNLNGIRFVVGDSPRGQFPRQLNPNNALYAWLTGYTDDTSTPITPSQNRKGFFEFDKSRLDTAGDLSYRPSRLPDSPFIYVDGARYSDAGSPAVKISDGEYYNPTSFQILCAGRDGEWGTDDDLSNFWPGTRADAER